ncbi:unnamed protein product [Cuscuta campestris]|uniref:Late embryogenesis abundant protein LEA-2 subgroup domain-containing protein n=1 Tax=Cuscuta campestris TaxID=132261 RepID=A0A484KHC9_9ASTE|nr:unnamed protein product [Cuscuta campestris]
MDGQRNRHAGNDRRPSEVIWEAITRWFDVGRERWVERAWHLFWWLVIQAVVLLVGFVIVWAVLQPHKPSFIVRSATVRGLNLSIPHIFSPDLEVRLAYHNRNRRIGIYYGEATVYATYRDRRITYNTHLPPVYQGLRAKDVWSFPLYGNSEPLDTRAPPSRPRQWRGQDRRQDLRERQLAGRVAFGIIGINEETEVEILNMIPNNNPVQPHMELLVHCKSKDNDLGPWKLSWFESRTIQFRVNLWFSTLFWCRFDWGSKFANVVVFDTRNPDFGGEKYLNWQVKTDGFYFASGDDPVGSDYKRLASWTDAPLPSKEN